MENTPKYYVFCLKDIRKKCCFSLCDKQQKAAFSDKLHQLSQMPWVEIRRSSRKALGSETIDQRAIKDTIPDDITEEVKLIAFRFWDKARMVGFRQGQTFHIVWLDIKFKLYDHGK